MAKGRWSIADDNFREQLDLFMVKTRMKREEIAAECEVCHATLNNYYKSPSTMPKKVERRLTMLFEKYGLRYDPTMGEGVRA